MQRFAIAIAAAKEREEERLRRVERARLAEVSAWEDLKASSIEDGKLCFKLDRCGGTTRVLSMLRGIVRVKQVSVLLFTVTFYANLAHSLTRSP
jgi:hypothetical protein